MKIEIRVDSVAGAVAAEGGGADRVQTSRRAGGRVGRKRRSPGAGRVVLQPGDVRVARYGDLGGGCSLERAEGWHGAWVLPAVSLRVAIGEGEVAGKIVQHVGVVEF